jgi:hypothetical protein
LHLQLEPPEVGRVEVRVEMRDGVLRVDPRRRGLGPAGARCTPASSATASTRGVCAPVTSPSDGGVGARDTRTATTTHRVERR